MPTGGRAYSEPVAESMADFRARAEKAGRYPPAVTVSIFGVPLDADKLAGLRDAGATRLVFFVPSAIAYTVLPLLDGSAAVAKKVGLLPGLDLLLRGGTMLDPGRSVSGP